MERMLDWLTGHGKPLQVKVTTMDADLNAISVDRDAPGQQLFDTVCKIIGLREVWYFGLCFTNRKGYKCWLQMDRKIRQQNVPKQPDGSYHFLFIAKFFPESIAELIQDMTRHLFFLQIRQSILSMDLYCPSEAAILLACYAVQAMYGDQQDGIELDLTKLIPPSVIRQFEMSAEMWDEKIRNWWANNSGMSREDAEEEFLCFSEELDMYGLQYYPIRNQRDTELLLGVSAQGLGIYEPENKLSPRPFFPWTEIKCISFKNKMFTICTADKSKVRFRAEDMSINQSLLDLCVGTHNLYLRRRQPDLLEVQQMRIQTQEQRQRRLAEQCKLQKEKESRVAAEMERDRLRAELGHMAEQLNTMQNVVKSAEETQQLIAERAKISEKEALEMARRANEAEAEMQRIKISHLRAEESKMALERKCQDAETFAQRLIQHQQKQQQQQQNGSGGNNGNNLMGGQPAAVATEPPPYPEQLFGGNAAQQQRPSAASDEEQQQNGGGKFGGKMETNGQQQQQRIQQQKEMMMLMDIGGNGGEFGQSFNSEMQNIYAELEQSRVEWSDKNESLREKLANFRAELEALKRDGTETENDRLFAQKLVTGYFDKHSTLRKSCTGTSKSRAQYFDEMTASNSKQQNLTTIPSSPHP